ncbi:MAG TPA: hypothetical protein VGS96_07470 [Thermoanaerobaculia bacterium]|nr:hypothetical protein [Thermoanaerobaculia bacterium]
MATIFGSSGIGIFIFGAKLQGPLRVIFGRFGGNSTAFAISGTLGNQAERGAERQESNGVALQPHRAGLTRDRCGHAVFGSRTALYGSLIPKESGPAFELMQLG